MLRLVASWIFLLLLALPVRAWAFPEMIRHHYPNCISCHYSTTGGGLLNDYGRQASKAVLSHDKFFFEPSGDETGKAKPKADGKPADSMEMDENDPEVKFLYGSVASPDWLHLGGDFRFLQFFENTPAFNQARFIAMQMDLEAAVTVGKFTLVGTIGRQEPTTLNPNVLDFVVNHQLYLNYQLTDEIVLTGGKYGKPYGINIPDHTPFIRSVLGWDISLDTFDTYNIQAAYLGDTYNLYVAYDLGRPDNTLVIEKGPVVTFSRTFADTYKIGASYFYGITDQFNRHVFGPWLNLGFTEHLYLMNEDDFVIVPQGVNVPSTTSGFLDYARLGYELTQGFHAYVDQNYAQTDFKNDLTRLQAYGVGLLYYPRPHWEFQAYYQKQKNNQLYTSFFDVIWFQFHYYL